ncbi:MAG: hypothetical protein KC549_02735 [Myxococcales bacterium]|nr:hypothetical protein [Myxococcales bacterium]MCB9547602.1 hypothetical protein [Myxococcales bacterium]
MTRRLVALGLGLALVACTDDEAATPGPGAEAPHATAPGFVQLYERLFLPSCAAQACHGSARGVAGLSFAEPRAAYATLTTVTPVNPVAAERGDALVAPGDVERSFLWHKLHTDNTSLTIEGLGARMPLGGAGAPGERTLAALRAWIEAGAPYTGQDFDADFTQNEDTSHYVACDAQDAAGLRACFGEAPGPDVVRYYSDPLVIPARSEVQICTYLDEETTETRAFRSFRARQMTGGHHSALYVAFQAEPPGVRSCTGAAMTNLRILAGAFSGTDGLVPDDVRLELPAGRQVVLQSHYINPTDAPITVMDAVELSLTTAEATPVLADSFVLNMDRFEIPAGAVGYEHGNGAGCRVGREIALHSIQLHTHEHGVYMELVRTPADGPPEVLLSETDGILMREGAAARLLDPALTLHPDDRLSVRCRFDNPGLEALGFPDEMCAAFMYYSPGEGFLLCDDEATAPEILGGGGDGEGCVAPDAPGNERGVGRACTAGGNECVGNGDARLCLATFDARANFCSLFGCMVDADCGAGAVCLDQDVASACVPVQCAD